MEGSLDVPTLRVAANDFGRGEARGGGEQVLVAVAAAPEPAPISNKQLKKQQAIAWRKSQKELERKTGSYSTGVKPTNSRREAAPKSKDNWWDDQL